MSRVIDAECRRCHRRMRIQSRGLCSSCYAKSRARARCATCGRLRTVHAKGLCHTCYMRQYNHRRATARIDWDTILADHDTTLYRYITDCRKGATQS